MTSGSGRVPCRSGLLPWSSYRAHCGAVKAPADAGGTLLGKCHTLHAVWHYIYLWLDLRAVEPIPRISSNSYVDGDRRINTYRGPRLCVSHASDDAGSDGRLRASGGRFNNNVRGKARSFDAEDAARHLWPLSRRCCRCLKLVSLARPCRTTQSSDSVEGRGTASDCVLATVRKSVATTC